MSKNSLWEFVVGIFTIVGALATVAELVAPRCSVCGAKLVIINNYYYCNNCGAVRSPR